MTDQPTVGGQVVNALKLVADVTILPGSGQLVEGKVGEGVAYGAVGLATKLISPLLGPLFWLPWIAVGLDSYAKSSSGRHLWQLSQPTAAPATVPQAPVAP